MSRAEHDAFQRVTYRMNRYEAARLERLNELELRVLIDFEIRRPQVDGTFTPQAAA